MISLTLLYVTINDIARLNEKTQDTTCYPLEIIRHHLITRMLIQHYFNIVPTATDNRPLTVVMGKQGIPGDLS